MFLSILKLVLLGYVGFTILLYLAQPRIVFPASRNVYRTPDAYGWDYEEVQLQVSDHTTHAWYIHAGNARGTVLFSHGNAGNIADRLESVALFRRLGYDVLLYDYGGYGKSTGRPSEQRCYADIRAMWRYLTEERGVATDRIVLFGRSLGAAVAADLATAVKPAGVILESSFLSAGQLAQELYPFLPARYLVRYKFDTAAKMGRITCPVLIVHSPDDEIIPYRHGQKLFELAGEPKTFLEIRGGHNEGFLISGSVYETGLATFLGSLFGPAPPSATGAAPDS